MKFDIFSYNLVKCLPTYPNRQNHVIDQFKKIDPQHKSKSKLFYGFDLDRTLNSLEFNKNIVEMNKDRPRQVRYSSGLPGALGCTISFCSCINIARLVNFPYLFLFDDDIIFVDNFNEKMDKYLEELPQDFSICLLGYFRDDFEKHEYSENLLKADNIHNNGGFGLLINRLVYDKIILDMAQNPMLLTDDFWYVNKYEKCFAVKDRLVLSSPDPRYSTIEGREHVNENKTQN